MELATTYVNPSTNDMELDTNGDIKMVYGIEAASALIRAAIQTNRGELEYFPNLGIPYFTTIFRNRVLAPLWAKAIKDRVMEFDFVKSIDRFTYEFDYERNTVKYEMKLTTDYGKLTIE